MKGCLMLHGFSGSPAEIAPLSSFLQEKTDWKIVTPTLPGHGKGIQLHGVKFGEWLAAAEASLQLLLAECEEVYLVGYSMGGVISGYLAAKYPVAKLVLLSAAYHYLAPRMRLVEMKSLMQDYSRNKHHENTVYQRVNRKKGVVTFSALREFQKLVHRHRSVYSEVVVPTFIAHGMRDSVIPVKSAKYIYKTLRATDKTMMWIDEADHCICFCSKSHVLFKQIVQFLQK